MLNQSAEYALRATLYMAHHGHRDAYKAAVVADELGVPANYLSKILHALVRARVLKSVRGPTGGYTLALAPAQCRIARVIAPFQELDQHGPCLMGDRACDPQQPCAAHQRWGQMKDTFTSFVRNTTLADMLIPVPQDANDAVTLTEVA